MKTTRVLGAALALLLALPAGVSAQDLSYVTLTGKEKDYSTTVTAIKVPVEENPVIEGENPLTGEPWEGEYKPVMTTIDTHPDAYPLWGVSSADIMFEMPIQKDGSTRGLALYMGEIPEGSGPVRSARIAAASLREIFNAPFVYYGMRETKSTSVSDWWKKYHKEFRSSGKFNYPLIDLMQPRYNEINQRVKDGHQNPHNVMVDVAAVRDLGDTNAKPRPFLFSDEGLTSGAKVRSITIPYKNNYNPSYTYDEEAGVYYRYNNGEMTLDGLNNQPAVFANVILLRTTITWKGNPGAVIPLVGEGTCEIFSNGYYQRGTWVRASSKKANEEDSLEERLVFLDENGEELVFKRGSTFISIMDNEQEVDIAAEGEVNVAGAKAGKAPEATPTPAPTRTPRPTRTPKPESGESTDTGVETEDDGGEGDVSFGG
jgi:hypothetical protein